MAIRSPGPSNAGSAVTPAIAENPGTNCLHARTIWPTTSRRRSVRSVFTQQECAQPSHATASPQMESTIAKTSTQSAMAVNRKMPGMPAE